MRHLKLMQNRSQLQTIGGILMVVCALLIIYASLEGSIQSAGLLELLFEVVPWLFVAGSLIFAFAQRGMRVASTSLGLNRLYTIQTVSHILFVLAGLLMVENFEHWLQPFFSNDVESYKSYLQIVHNNWVVFILIGAIIQLYTVFRISTEIKKHK